MRCLTCCIGEIRPGRVTVTLERGGVTLLIRDAPAEVCEICGERYFAEESTRELRRALENAEQTGEELQIRSFAARHEAPPEV